MGFYRTLQSGDESFLEYTMRPELVFR